MEASLIFVNIAVLFILVVGLFMTLIGLPGNVVLFITVLGYAFYDGFVHIGWQALAVVIASIILGEFFETLTGAFWAQRERASKMAIGVAVFGTIFGGLIGTAVFPVVGSIIGAFLGGFLSSYIAEYYATNDKNQAWRVAISVIKGQLLGIVLKFTIAVATIVYLLIHMPW